MDKVSKLFEADSNGLKIYFMLGSRRIARVENLAHGVVATYPIRADFVEIYDDSQHALEDCKSLGIELRIGGERKRSYQDEFTIRELQIESPLEALARTAD